MLRSLPFRGLHHSRARFTIIRRFAHNESGSGIEGEENVKEAEVEFEKPFSEVKINAGKRKGGRALGPRTIELRNKLLSNAQNHQRREKLAKSAFKGKCGIGSVSVAAG
ncbi:hypothetical protein BT69DRAFT_1016052 [Atractiella rhizophila]|nr:hypothetical protein BT69DRAFT_1016052 [Atractiella rhizophila]